MYYTSVRVASSTGYLLTVSHTCFSAYNIAKLGGAWGKANAVIDEHYSLLSLVSDTKVNLSFVSQART